VNEEKKEEEKEKKIQEVKESQLRYQVPQSMK